MFVLDRLDPSEVGGGVFPGPAHRRVLEFLVEYAGRELKDCYVSPVVACPPRDPVTLYNEQMIPLAKNPEVVTCGERVHAEVHAIQPKIVVACGQAAAKSLLPMRTPNVQNSAGSVVQAYVRGEHVSYPVPVMLTASLQDLVKIDANDTPGPWESASQHILDAFNLADQLIRMEKDNG